MENPLREWWPNENQRRLGEKYLFPVVSLVQVLTRWYIVLLWAFLVPFLMGQGLLASLMLSAISSLVAYVLFEGDYLRSLAPVEPTEDTESE